ncbi:hypothetical protein UCRPA7_967 [Phaeoacremonium minimum UCRPA7]|uniref:Uncharacterized protein n=1 Tax=Phaeoacremonium minimum (strain UCR-PA7) TaxID=1286976 RepID=R8BVX9_PHAM7|nr:hypothetical protein UCRPA7_967 [Phaeoacremonium minimum UCRPA7]EOO03502.1 hypothetical protein UCRPA7_967 [Phaeoacremonium minimum UCRPA7]
MNGMNGGQMPAMVGFPTPAGHQAELTYIYGMVEELSRQLAENKRVLEDVVAGVGRVRSRARAQSLGNEELIASASDDINSQEGNMDTLISLLSEALEKAKYSRDANAALLTQYASVIATMLKQFHEYKSKHVTDVNTWHRSYRAQLAEARAENSRLREQIWEMQQHAGKANENLRRFRTKYDEDEARWEKRVDMKSIRQELRFWKRLAMPEMADDDPYWSDDDDLIDPAEKDRLRDLRDMEKKAAQDQLAGAGVALGDQQPGGEEQDASQLQQAQTANLLGGTPMQRDDGSGMTLSQAGEKFRTDAPPRPLSD